MRDRSERMRSDSGSPTSFRRRARIRKMDCYSGRSVPKAQKVGIHRHHLDPGAESGLTVLLHDFINTVADVVRPSCFKRPDTRRVLVSTPAAWEPRETRGRGFIHPNAHREYLE